MRLQDNGDSISVRISASETYAWSRRPGAAWPCSTLADRRIFAAFDRNGLFDLAVDGKSDADVDVHEFNALTSDMLAKRLQADHPCYFVTVGQFRAERAL
jgi:hypothetical protein